MADLTEIQAAGITKIVGSDLNGLEQSPVSSDTAGSLSVRTKNSSGGDALPSTIGRRPASDSVSVVLASDEDTVYTEDQPTAVTYFAATATGPFAPANNATDIFVISGSATKLVKIHQIVLSATQNTAGINTFFLLKRSSDNAGGTFTSINGFPADSTDPAETVTIRSYTANPSALGTLIGALDLARIVTPTTSGTVQPYFKWDFTSSSFKPIILRGTSEILAINFNGASRPTGLSVGVSVVWTEW